MIWLLAVVALTVGVGLGPSLHRLAVASGGGEQRAFRPACDGCGTSLPFRRWWAGSCPRCGVPVRRRVVWFSIGTGVVLGVTVPVTGIHPTLVAYLLFAAVTVTLVVTDFDHKRIPNRVLYPGTVLVLAALAGGAVLEHRAGDLARAVAGGAALFGVFLVVALVARGGFGMGDVKLAFLLGAVTAYRGWTTLITAVLLSSLLGGLPALVLLATRRAGRHDELPYGPALIAGSWLALGLATRLGAWYLG